MATISMFFGIIVSMICEAGCRHSKPHVHVWYQGHQASLLANWEIALNGGEVYKINPLQK